MAPRSKTRTTQNILLGIAAATTLAAGLVWAYQNLSNSSEEEGSNEVREGDNTAGSSKERDHILLKKNGSKPILCLSTPVLPPPTLIKNLSELYTLHLLLPSTNRFSLPSIYNGLMDSRRVLFHEKGEGLIHISRTLGGILVVVKSGYGISEVEGDSEGEEEEGLEGEEVVSLASSAREEESASSHEKVLSGTEPIKLEKLVKEVSNFVNHILIVVGNGGGEKVKPELGAELSKVKVLEGWKGLSDVLGV